MATFTFTQKAKQIADLKQQLTEVTKDRDGLLEKIKDYESKIEATKQATETFSQGSQDWEKEKQSLIESHAKALSEVNAKLESSVKEQSNLVETHKEEVMITEEIVNQKAAVKINAMNLSEGVLPQPTEKEQLTIEQAVQTLATLSGKARTEFYNKNVSLFREYLQNSTLNKQI